MPSSGTPAPADDQADKVEGTDASNTAGSPAADGKDVKTTADVLDAVLADSKAGSESSSDSSETGQDGQEDGKSEAGDKPDAAQAADGKKPDEDELSDRPSDEEFASYKGKTRRRVQQLLDKVDAYRDFGTPEEVAAFKQSHERLSGLTDYMGKHHLSVEEVNNGFTVMADIKAAFEGRLAPEKALDVLAPYIAQLQEMAGQTLPDDLNEKVKLGLLDQDSARELAKGRSSAALRQAAAEQAAKAAETQQVGAAQKRVEDNATAANAWEEQWRKSDPDYDKKRPRVLEKMELHLARTVKTAADLPTPAEVTKLLTKFRTEVDQELRNLLPKRPAVTAVLDDGAAGTATRAPQTAMEALEKGLAAAAG